METVKNWTFFYCLLRRYLIMRTLLCEYFVHCVENNSNFAAVSKHHIIKTNKQVNTLRTGDADLRFYITTVQDG